MTDAEIAARDVGRGFTDADIAEVMDSPEWTDEQLRNARPFAEVFPEWAASIERDLAAKENNCELLPLLRYSDTP